MKLLISAYACAPNRGSDHGVGWNWATEAHRLGHRICVLASSAHKDSIARVCEGSPDLQGIKWVFPEVAGWPLRQGVEPSWERTYNLLWQRAAIKHARALQRAEGFDAVHHLTWAGIRAPTFLGSIGTPLIVGPIGGGETSPASLRDSIGLRGKLLETIRDLSNATITINPATRSGLRDAAVIFTTTAETRALFTDSLRAKSLVFTQLALPSAVSSYPPRPNNAAPRFLYAGRLLYWKGVHIALHAFAAVRSHTREARFTIVGDGPERARLEAEVQRLQLADAVEFHVRLPQDELFKLYDSHDLFLFPSLHDSGGFVALEALSRGLPVVCLDLGGPGDLVTPESGLVIETEGRSTEAVAAAMAREIIALLSSPARLAERSMGAFQRSRQFLLADRIEEFYGLAMDFIGGHP